MYQVLKKYRRRLMAFFAVGLMVAFLIPTMSGRSGQGGAASAPAGTVAGQTVYMIDLHNAQQEWDILKRDIQVSTDGYSVQPLASMLGQLDNQNVQRNSELYFRLRNEAIRIMQEVDANPALYMLLQKEATQMGIFVARDRVDDLYNRLNRARAFNLDMKRPENVQIVKQALSNFLMVQDAFGHAAGVIKASQPYRDYELATGAQEMKVNAVEFAAADFSGKLTDPTRQQLQEQYDKWVEVDREMADATTDPFGFGYRFPSRVKLQYLCIPASELRKAVEMRQPSGRWEVDARKYHLLNEAQFSATTQEASATGPTTRRVIKPFEEVRKEVMESLIRPEIEKLQGEVSRYVSGVLAADWNASQTVGVAKEPSSLGVSYQSYEYLQKLAADVRGRFHVALTIEQWSDYLSQRDLATKGGIGLSRTIAQIWMPRYAMLDSKAEKAVVDREQRQTPGLPKALEFWQPSQMLKDEANNVYVFRLTASDKARKPTGLDEVIIQVEKDWRLAQSMKLAREGADAFLATAKEKGFATIAQAAKKQFLSSDYFSRSSQVVMGLRLVDDAAVARFTSEAATLLAMKTKDYPRPVAVLELPHDGRVFVAQLDDVRSRLTPDILGLASQAMGERFVAELRTLFSTQWFDYQNVVKRMKYVPGKRSGEPMPVEDNSPPNFPTL